MRPRNLINTAVSFYLSRLYTKLRQTERHFLTLQYQQLHTFLKKARKTEIGKEFRFDTIRHYRDFSQRVPIRKYDDIRPLVHRMMEGETNVLWPGLVTWFSKSSGTTSDKSKFIPVTSEHLNHTHNRGGWYSLALLYHRNPEARVFGDKNLVLTGSIYKTQHPDIRYGDVSAIMRHHLPWIGRPFFTPDFKTSLLPDWDQKIEIMANVCGKQNVGVIAGVPTWAIVLFRRILELSGKQHMLEVWPNACGYIHGGVGFDPYWDQFHALFPSDQFTYHEIYNASEGYFGSQDTDDRKEGLLLFPDTGIFYELIPESEWNNPNPSAIPIQDGELGVSYGLVITTNGGLWRYNIGDTVMLTSKDPYRICITGRTQQFINAFGEEVMVDNTDRAIADTARKHNAQVSDYTAAPIYMSLKGKGAHHWLVEFERAPLDIELFASDLDKALKNLNADYEAKRFQDMALERLHLTILPNGTFRKWMQKKGKSGSQAKVPRLSNDRRILEDILSMVNRPMIENDKK